MFFGRRKPPTFGTVAQEVLKLKELKAEETKKAARRQIKRLIANFGSVRIDEVTEILWADYVARERARRARTFYDDRKYMRIVLNYAIRQGWLSKRVDLPIPDVPGSGGRELTMRELMILERNAGPTLRFQIRIGWKMGLRLREMMRLRWDQFDWINEVIRFVPKDTKTRRPRVVPIPIEILPQFKARLALAESVYVFPGRGGTRPQDNNRTAWRRLKRKTGISCRWHDLRHTCASLLLRKSVQTHVASRYLGMSEKVLKRIYAHVNSDDLKKAMEAIKELG